MGRRTAAWAFHVARAARERFGLEGVPAGARGDLIATDMPAIRRLAFRMSAARPVGWAPVLPGQIAAMAVLHELGHLVIERHGAVGRPLRAVTLEGALGALRLALGAESDRLLATFAREFPGDPDAAAPEPPADLLAELLLIRVANENPAAEPVRELIDDRPLEAVPAYPRALAVLEKAFGGGDGEAGPDPGSGALLAILRAPAAHAPTSLQGQLRFVREHWVPYLGAAAGRLLAQLDGALGELAEEEAALHRGFGGVTSHGFGPAQAPDLSGLAGDAERFSADSDWMPGLVLQARSTYVWLDQLSRRHGRAITTLDAIPDEELDRLGAWGVNGLWLIGVWERSKASEEIKHRRGNPDAIASAYSLDDYRIAADLGGEDALARLRDRARARGIRLACDMVPNHMGIDSGWVIEHPEWFLSVADSPYPAYGFSGPNLSRDERVEILLEDHYWDGSDAAVVFLRRDRASGETRFIYHGNDGTSLPWNDTAQLDFVRADVREQVIRTIVDVARRFPVIRFDAAMVLARRHIERLWWPEPGAGGGVPSRAAHAIPKAEFDRLMPAEFWREVVDRVAAEVPDTLLLAEAFWLMEGYFVRTLGMHRVYNSAFMHMLRDEDIAGYRRVIRDTIEFDPEILERYVNFMSNPDEASALEQFGRDDKCFGVATVLATLPGLPMLGHGQVEGFAEKYGMEFRRAMRDEAPDPGLIARHEREIAPLLRQRRRFARAAEFRLYDLVCDDGSVDEGVLAYSNGRGDGRSLVVYYGRFAEAAGRLRDSAAFAVKNGDGTRAMARQSLADALELPGDADAVVGFRDHRTGLEHLASAGEVRGAGLPIRLGAYGYQVFEAFRVLEGGRARWGQLLDRLDGGGVPSLEAALLDLDLAPLHDGLRALFADGHVARLAEAMAPEPEPEPAPATREAPLQPRVIEPPEDADSLAGALQAVAAWDRDLRAEGARAGAPDPSSARDPRTPRDRLAGAPEAARRISRVAPLLAGAATRLDVTLVLALGGGSFDPRVGDAARARFDACRLAGPLADGLRSLGLDDAAAAAGAARIRALLALPRPASTRPAQDAASQDAASQDAASHLAGAWLADPAVGAAVGINRWEGADWLVREAWEALVDSAAALHAMNAADPAEIATASRLAGALRAAAETAGYRVDRFSPS